MEDMETGTVGKEFRLHRTPYKAASAKNIVQLDYFIKEEHRLEILEYCKKSEFFNNNTKILNKSLEDYENSDKSIPFHRGLYRNILRVGSDTTPEVFDLISEYQKRAMEVIQYKFGFPIIPMDGSLDLRKWHPGELQEPHADSEGIDDGTDDYSVDPFMVDNFSSLFIDVGCVMYLNDDYVGGGIHFPAYDIEIHPKAGDLLFFPGSNLYMHGVREIIKGNRFTITTFYSTPKLMFLKKYIQEHVDIYPS
jgi:hypothetical protein